ncbi:MAG TPA: glycoside hydrolase family 38 C-terminal domain-containing protein, partial [Acidimicrobiales bacterium]|nr:glycoside hydrolase family 38 C-terminal domain-containing protein [Acidimicrobiales bacterium]
DRDRSDTSLYPFGFGDGGGGPTSAMLERARRASDLDGLPRVEVGSAAGFLESIDTSRLATWVGELYLEFHRGTFTTHADVKLANRRGEEALRAAELWSVAAGMNGAAELERAWKLLLFNQFHDIIPGSSIAWVYEDAAADYAELMRIAGNAIDNAQGQVARRDEAGWVAFNPSSYDRVEIVDCDGEPAVARVPGCGWGVVDPIATDGVERALESSGLGTVRAGDGWIENDQLRATWDRNGLLTSVWDRQAEREVLGEGELGNVFQIHEDHPKSFDAWEVDRNYLESREDIIEAESVELVEFGPLRAAVRVVRSFGNSRISQVMSLSAGAHRLEFHTDVDWHESHRFLKVAFPVAVRSTRATYEIQHGHIERPTVENTSWDQARFEVCAHRWADLSEPGYGVALINDCKYGYDIRGNVMRLSLLRAPGYPDPCADRGPHRFGYALFPHAGDLRDAGVVEQAEWFNLPLEVRRGAVEGEGRVVEIDRRGVSVEAVKRADDGDGVIVRLCEVHGSRGPVRVKLNVPHGPVWRTDLLERKKEEVDVRESPKLSIGAGGPPGAGGGAGDGVELHLRPFELVTLRFASSGPPAAVS